MTSRPKAHSSTLFVGGQVWSPADQAGPQPAELLVVDGRIAAMGEHLGVTDGTQGAERIDLRGGTLLPAFGDGHAHPVQGGIERRHAAVRVDSLEAVLDGVRAWAAEHPGSDWIYGAGFDLA